MSIEEMSAALHRTVPTIAKLLHDVIEANPDDRERMEISRDLRSSQKWQVLKQEFTDEELKFFEEEYTGMMSQFKGGVLHTEVSQVFDAIRLEILKNRNMAARKKALQDIEYLQDMYDKFMSGFDSPRDLDEDQRAQVFDLQSQINIAKSREQEKTKEWTDLQQRVEKIRVALKASRDQRVQDIESKGVDFLDVIRKLQNRDQQEKASRDLQLGRMAAKKELEALGQPHRYEDGMIDLPILSADSVANLDIDPDDEATTDSNGEASEAEEPEVED